MKSTRRAFAQWLGAAAAVLVAPGPIASGQSLPRSIEITLEVGRSTAIPATSISSYSMSGPDIILVEVVEQSLRITGNMPGDQGLLLIYSDGHLQRYLVHATPSPAPNAR